MWGGSSWAMARKGGQGSASGRSTVSATSSSSSWDWGSASKWGANLLGNVLQHGATYYFEKEKLRQMSKYGLLGGQPGQMKRIDHGSSNYTGGRTDIPPSPSISPFWGSPVFLGSQQPPPPRRAGGGGLMGSFGGGSAVVPIVVGVVGLLGVAMVLRK